MNQLFRTEIKLKKEDFPKITYENKIFLIGSCFSEKIGHKFKHFKFSTMTNPFGVSYNPISLEYQINRLTTNTPYQEEDLFIKNDLYNSYELHGSYDHHDKIELLKNVNQKIDDGFQFLKETNHLYITLGTAWVYILNENQKVVNNCHKQPAHLFSRKLLTVAEVEQSLKSIISHCQKINPEINIIFTISPVRHLKDGFIENSLSKSLLRVAIGNILNQNHLFYFPSYEIMIDDLRDYRFYEEDMLHPNEIATNYIWNKIKNIQVHADQLEILNQVESLVKAFEHRPFNTKSITFQEFIISTNKKATELQKQFNSLDFSKEISELQLLASE